MHTFRSSIRCAWLAAGLALLSLTASAQVDKPVRLLVGFTPGGSADIAARLLAERLKDDLKQTVTVENKPGAGGRIAAEMLKNAAPDGATVVLAPIVVPVLAPLVFSEVPTFAEAGLKGVEGTSWFAVYAPAKTPDATIRQLNAAINIALAVPELRKRFAELGLEPTGRSAADLAALMKRDTERWAPVVTASGLKAD